MITVENLCKDFTARRQTGRRFLLPVYEKARVPAVKGISFDVKPGERVAFIGPNGAGKSTTLKMLSGILQPTSGRATVAGHVPWEARKKLAYEIGLVFGQRSQLWHHLPARESFALLGRIYGLPGPVFLERMKRLERTFHLAPLLNSPVKSFSLGQRMRCEVAATLLHAPKILFLDEPTIGLDVTAKAELRDHLLELGAEDGTTIILTSHDTDDIEKICDRVILIDQGEKLIDMPLADMRKKYLRQKRIVFTTAEETPKLDLEGALSIRVSSRMVELEIDPAITPVPVAVAAALKQLDVHDISVSDVPLEEVIQHIYKEGRG